MPPRTMPTTCTGTSIGATSGGGSPASSAAKTTAGWIRNVSSSPMAMCALSAIVSPIGPSPGEQHDPFDGLTGGGADAREVVEHVGVIDDLEVGDGDALEGAHARKRGVLGPVERRVVGQQGSGGQADPS